MVETPGIAVDPVRIEGPINLPAATVGAVSALGHLRGFTEFRLATGEPKRVLAKFLADDECAGTELPTDPDIAIINRVKTW
jgi:hypothetical protein